MAKFALARALFTLTLFLCAPLTAMATKVGANGMDLMLAYHGQSSSMGGSAAETWTGTAMGRRMIADAKDMGFKFMRVAVGGFGPSDTTDIGWGVRDSLTPWLTSPNTYWAATDRMFDDLDAAGLQIVPVLMWNPPQFPAMSHETFSQMINGPSTSRLMAKSYIQAFLRRYSLRKTILFVELTNEWNLMADLDEHTWCLQNGMTQTQCAPMDNITTPELASFVTGMATFVHHTAPGILVSSGFALPRASAWHLSQTPASSPSGPDWTLDTPTEFAANIAQLHQGLDIVSVHIYPGDVRFGRQAGTEGQTAADVAAIAHRLGKKIYVGEFGDSSESAYLASMWQGFSTGQVDYASFWAMEFYQFSTTQLATGFNLDPQETGTFNNYISAQIGAAAPEQDESARVVLAAPVPCSTESVGQPFSVYAHASGAAGVSDVKFYLDGVQVADSSAPPYQAWITVQQPEVATVQAVVSNGTTITSTAIPIAVGVPASSCTVPSPISTSAYTIIAPAAEQAQTPATPVVAAPVSPSSELAVFVPPSTITAQAAAAAPDLAASASHGTPPATQPEEASTVYATRANPVAPFSTLTRLNAAHAIKSAAVAGRTVTTVTTGAACQVSNKAGPLFVDRLLRLRQCGEPITNGG